jgi:hypothetical protein
MALFKLGQVHATPAATACCLQNNITPLHLIRRHAGGDWGELCTEDVASNVHALQHDERILSAYVLSGVKLYCVTEWDRTLTTLLLANEY